MTNVTVGLKESLSHLWILRILDFKVASAASAAAAEYHDTTLGGVTDGSTKFNITPKKCDVPQRDVMGTVFCGCQQFSLCTASGQREMLVMSITASLCTAAAGGSV